MTAYASTIGRQLREARIARGWTQADLGARAGIAQATIAKTESGDTQQPRLPTLQRIADALGKPLAYFYQETEPTPPRGGRAQVWSRDPGAQGIPAPEPVIAGAMRESAEPDPTDDFSGDTLEFAHRCAQWALGEDLDDIPEGMPVGLLALKLKWGRHLGRGDFAMLHSLADSRQHARRAQMARRWSESDWEEVWFRLTRKTPPSP